MRTRVRWKWLALTCLVAAAPALGQVSADERQALIDFYHATGGDDWHNNGGWLAEAGSECSWHGIQCATPYGSVVLRIMLSDNNLTGQLPDSLDGQDRLVTLVLSNNSLTGPISPDLWGLSSLQDLFLDGNRFTGEIPVAVLGMSEGAPHTQVRLSGNRLDGFASGPIPEPPLGREIELTLGDNRIDQLPPPAWRATGAIEQLDLSGNRIEGALALDDGSWPGLKELNLADNGITELAGLADDDLPDLETLDLAWNRLSKLPESLLALDNLSRLELGNNDLSGELPEWFADMNLGFVGLDNNDLSGPIDRVFAALDTDNFPHHTIRGQLGLHLHVANNHFTGPLPDVDFERFNLAERGPSSAFGLDLCFNPIELPSAERLEMINPVHRGRALAPCLDRGQAELDRTISGSWYQPERSGEGFTQMLLDNGRMLNYWFTYTPPESDQAPEQRWLLGITEPGPAWSEFKPMWITNGGRFGAGIADGSAQPSRTWMRHNRTDSDSIHFMYHHNAGGICITGACSSEILSERFDLTRLTNLAGTTCDNQAPYQEYSGAWYNPERSGEGFIIEILPGKQAVVYWFTHKPDVSGEQAWMIGQGEIVHQGVIPTPFPGTVRARIVIESMIQPTGGRFGPNFDPEAIEYVDWGRMEIGIDIDGSDGAIVGWESQVEGYGSGSYELERLARPRLADCD